MTERVDICNGAMTLLGARAITSIDDESTEAETCKIWYSMARDATLEAYEWSFAIKRFMPSKLAEAPVYGAANAFPVPPEIIRILSCDRPTVSSTSEYGAPIDSRGQIEWVFEEGNILCNEEVIYCRGVQRVKEEGRFSPCFVQALAAQLAAMTALTITKSDTVQSNMYALFKDMISQAKSRDGLQGRSRRFRARQPLQAR
jgi:hypothetical protein